MNNNNLNVFLAVLLSIGIILGWQYFYEKPRAKQVEAQRQYYNTQVKSIKSEQVRKVQDKDMTMSRTESIGKSDRVYFENKDVKGSINLKGARVDDLILRKYRATSNPDSRNIELLSPSNSNDPSFIELGWLSRNNDEDLPNSESVWKSDKKSFKTGEKVNLYWINKEGAEFILTISIDNNYLLHIDQKIANHSTKPIYLQNYGLINKVMDEKKDSMLVVHEGPIGYIDGKLVEETYAKVKDNKKVLFSSGHISWIGITEKYWLTSFIPNDKLDYKSSFNYGIKKGRDRYQVDFIGTGELVQPKSSYTMNHKIFVGPKRLELLEKYEKEYHITLFDRAVDFGWLYILTKPLFYALNFFHEYTGNFGVSILIVTVIVKLLMFGLANKSYRSMKKMKALQPEIERLKDLYGDDKAKFNQEVMSLYKKQQVNPLSGCLPILVQIPVFFAIYKVLNVTIEMRQAPFFGWIHNLSAPDPTNIFNLFGLLPITPASFLHLGAWPIIMVITMYLQQRMSPAPTDPTQAQVMKFMPLMFLFMFGGFPSGLLIYWAWSNILSIAQQYYITKLSKT